MSKHFANDMVMIPRIEYEEFVRDSHTVELICELIQRDGCLSLPLIKVLVGIRDDTEDSEKIPDGIGIFVEGVEDI